MNQEEISIHAPREGSDSMRQSSPLRGLGISIHAPREGSDCHENTAGKWQAISIHAPREGSDRVQLLHLAAARNFNPRSP